MIDFGRPVKDVWVKDGADLPVFRVPLEVDGQIVATIELWGDIAVRPDGSAYLTVGAAVGGFAVLKQEDLERIGFRVGMVSKEPRVKG